MPNTITSTDFTDFTAKTKARASEVNSNFDVLRGTRLPINADTSSASDSTHDLGSSEHRWKDIYGDSLDLGGLTSTADAQIKNDAASTSGSILFQFNNSTSAKIPSGGIAQLSPNTKGFTTSAALGQIALGTSTGFISTSVSFNFTTSSITLVTNGGPVIVGFMPDSTDAGGLGAYIGGTNTSYVRYFIDSTATNVPLRVIDSFIPPGAFFDTYVLSAGTHTVYAEFSMSSGDSRISNVRLFAREL